MLVCLLILAIALRLLVWRWHDQYPLGGDEQEYLAQALTFLQQKRYTELRFMRPPLYTGFLIATIYLFDSLIQQIRLVQAIVSACTILPIYGLTRMLFGQRTALIAAFLTALSYTLAATATELLSETLFLFGLSCCLWLLIRSATLHTKNYWMIALSGCAIGILALIRSVALPLIPLGMLWLFLQAKKRQQLEIPKAAAMAGLVMPALVLLLVAVLTLAPWTTRNYVTYGGFILIDTTGAENLWLDNDPAGRESVKRQLYSMGEDRLARQQRATQQGIAVISADIPRFLNKATIEATRFFALQYYDDLRDRPAIWVSPADVTLRLLLGDTLWLVVLFAGVAGLWLAPSANPELADLRWVGVPWALYTVLTACVFHVELRYRLPLWPVLLPYAAWALDSIGCQALSRHQPPIKLLFAPWQRIITACMLLSLALLTTLTLLHRPYISDTITLITKHIALKRAEFALNTDRNLTDAIQAASEALRLDERSVLARVILARSAIRLDDQATAITQLQDAEEAISAHPYPHLLHGAILLHQGDYTQAQHELAYETASLEDLQSWAWHIFPEVLPATSQVNLGGGLDLGAIQGFYAAETNGTRWSTNHAIVRLLTPNQPATINLRVNGDRPSGAPIAQLTIHTQDISVSYRLTPGWQTIAIPIRPTTALDSTIVTLEIATFRPRDFDRASPDNRDLGVLVDWVKIQ